MVCDSGIKCEIQNNLEKIINCNYQLILIGSYSDGSYNEKSDVDFMLFLDAKYIISHLQDLSIKINDSIRKLLRNIEVSIKIYDEFSFNNLYFNDFFRFYEYSISNKTILNTLKENVLEKKFRKLNKIELKENFINSIIIQYHWSLIKILEKRVVEGSIISKLLFRIERNYFLFKRLIDMKEFNDNKPLLKDLIIANCINNIEFSENYFSDFMHERINQFDYYQKILDDKKKEIGEVKKTIIKKIENELLFTKSH